MRRKVYTLFEGRCTRVYSTGVQTQQSVTAGGGIYRLKEIRELAREVIFERGEPVEDVYALVWLESHRLAIERCAELVEQFIILRLEITLIEVIADDERLKRHFGEVSRERVLAVDFGNANRHGLQRAEPFEMRQQLGEGQGRNLKKDLSFFEKVSPAVLATDNLCAAPLEKA